MGKTEILTTISGSAAETVPICQPPTALEVALEEPQDGRPVVALRRLTWATSLGWCRQQTLRLTPEEAESIVRVLRSNRRKWSPSPVHASSNVIPFPGRTKKRGDFHREAAPPDPDMGRTISRDGA